jgi:hypothetical protein
MATYTIFKIATLSNPNQVYVDSTVSSLDDALKQHQLTKPDATVECIQEVTGDAKIANIAVCYHIRRIESLASRYSENVKVENSIIKEGGCNAHLRSPILECMMQYNDAKELPIEAINFILKYCGMAEAPPPQVPCGSSAAKSAVGGQCNAKVSCGLCGFVCRQKNMGRHAQNTRCKKRQESNQRTPQESAKVALTLKQKANETQRTKHACGLCGYMTAKSNMKRHQAGSNCVPAAEQATCE